MKVWHGKSLVGHIIELELEWRGHTAIAVSSDRLPIDNDETDGMRPNKRRSAVPEQSDLTADCNRSSRSSIRKQRARVLAYSSILNQHLIRWGNSPLQSSSEASEGDEDANEPGEWLILHKGAAQSEIESSGRPSSRTVISFEVIIDVCYKPLPGEQLQDPSPSLCSKVGGGMEIIRSSATADSYCGTCRAHISGDYEQAGEGGYPLVERRCGSCRQWFHESCSPQVIVPWNPNATTKAATRAAADNIGEWKCWSCSGMVLVLSLSSFTFDN